MCRYLFAPAGSALGNPTERARLHSHVVCPALISLPARPKIIADFGRSETALERLVRRLREVERGGRVCSVDFPVTAFD